WFFTVATRNSRTTNNQFAGTPDFDIVTRPGGHGSPLTLLAYIGPNQLSQHFVVGHTYKVLMAVTATTFARIGSKATMRSASITRARSRPTRSQVPQNDSVTP